MKDYYSIFVDYSLHLCNENDYDNKNKVRQHNVFAKKLNTIKTEMKSIDCTGVIYQLLFHEDERVVINAVDLCYRIGVLPELASAIAEKLYESSEDKTIKFAAKIMIDKYK